MRYLYFCYVFPKQFFINKKGEREDGIGKRERRCHFENGTLWQSFDTTYK